MSVLKAVSVVAVISALLAVAFVAYNPLQESQLSKEVPTCTARSTMIARAQDWVDKHVPYSGTGSYAGYRTDCSGYVSMCWELGGPGLTTSTLNKVSGSISKDSLQPGDAIICEAEHVILFGGWTDSTKTHYVGYEEANASEGTIKRVTPYPYWYHTDCFHPIRYNSVC